MDIFSIILVVSGLVLFETVSSIDNAIVNAEVLSTMSERARRWFLVWGLLFAVFLVRGFLPLLIVFLTTPSLGLIGAFTATFSSDPEVLHAIERSAPILLVGGGTFLILLFLHWLYVEHKHYALPGEKFFHAHSIWFFAVSSMVLSLIVWHALKINPLMAFGAVVGSTAFFIMHGFKENAAAAEKQLVKGHLSDISKIFYLEILDATFSVDGVLGAFAFTLSVPLILLGNGIGAFVVREFTIRHIHTVKKYLFLKNGAMYSISVLGLVMLAEGFGAHVPEWFSPVLTFLIIGYFFFRSKLHLAQNGAVR